MKNYVIGRCVFGDAQYIKCVSLPDIITRLGVIIQLEYTKKFDDAIKFHSIESAETALNIINIYAKPFFRLYIYDTPVQPPFHSNGK